MSFQRPIDIISVHVVSIVSFPTISALGTYAKLFWYSAESM